MVSEYYQFQVGDFNCISISDGGRDYDPRKLFLPKDGLLEWLDQSRLATDRLYILYTCLFVDTGRHRVLIDMGAGDMASTTGKLVPGIKAAGIDLDSIDTVIITHAHGDHIGGTLNEAGQPIYGHAKYYICAKEWDFWMSEDAFTRAPERHVRLARKNLSVIRERLELVEPETELVPGIKGIAAPGHTPGHLALSIASQGEQLIHFSDTAVLPLHLEHPGWILTYDIDAKAAAESRRTIFDRASKEKALVFGHHFPPFPNLGYVVKKDEGWLWQPI